MASQTKWHLCGDYENEWGFDKYHFYLSKEKTEQQEILEASAERFGITYKL